MAAQELPTVRFGDIAIKLQDVAEATANRAWRADRKRDLAQHHPFMPEVVYHFVNINRRTFDAAIHLCLDSRARTEWVVAVPMLTRSIVDALFAVVFLFDAPTARTRWFIAAGVREGDKEHDRMRTKHGGNPLWHEWLDGHAREIDKLREDVHPDCLARANPAYWPNPGKMPRRTRCPERQALLRHLDEWYYGELSQDSHLSFLGLARRGAGFSPTRAGDAEDLGGYRQRVATALVATYLALLSQLALELRLERQALRLREVWDHFAQVQEVREMYERWYEPKLTALAAEL